MKSSLSIALILFFLQMIEPQVNRLGIVPFDVPSNVPKEAQTLAPAILTWTREYLTKLDMYQIIEESRLRTILENRRISLEDIYDLKQREKALLSLSQDIDYLVLGAISFPDSKVEMSSPVMGISCQLIRTADGRLLKSTAVGGTVREARVLTLSLMYQITPGKDEILREVEDGYQKYLQSKDCTKAVSFATWGLKLNPKSWQFHHQRGKAHEACQYYTKACEDYREALKLYGKASQPMEKDIERITRLVVSLKDERTQLLSQISQKTEKYQREHIERRLDILIMAAKEISRNEKNKSKLDELNKKATTLKKDFNDLFEELPKEKLASPTRESNLRLSAMDIKLSQTILQSEEVLKTFHTEFKQYAEQYFSTATALYRQDKLDEAFVNLEKTILLAPESANAYYWQGMIFGKSKKYPQALEALTIATMHRPEYWEAFYNRGLLYMQLGQRTEASEDFNTTIKLKPEFTEAYISLAEIQQDLNQEEKALGYYNQAMHIDEKFAMAYFQRGKLYEKQCQYLKARQDYQQVIKLSLSLKSKAQPLLERVEATLRKNAIIYADRATTCIEEGELQQALEYFDRSLENDSDNAMYYFQRGYVHHAMGNDRKAIENYDIAISLQKDQSRFYFLRAISYQYLKEYQKALNDLNTVLEFNPYSHAAYHRRGLIYEEQAQHGLIYEEQAHYEEAANNIEQAVKIAENKSYYYVDLARIYRKMNKPNQENATWQRARSVIK